MPELLSFVAQTLSQKGMILNYYFLFWDTVQAMKLKTLGNEPEEIVNEDLGYVSQIFLPKTMGNDPKPCSFVYVIVPATYFTFPLMHASVYICRDRPGHS